MIPQVTNDIIVLLKIIILQRILVLLYLLREILEKNRELIVSYLSF